MAPAIVAQPTPAHTHYAEIVAYNMTPAEINALADEIMQDTLMRTADAYREAVCQFPSLYLTAEEWDVHAAFAGNSAGVDLPF